MVIAVMQPYVFPYLGYYQLVNAVDTFVFFDDVNYIMKGWINRNRVLQKNQPITFTIPLSKASQNRLINEIELSEFNRWRDAFLKQIAQYYGKAPYFTEVNAWLVDFFTKNEFTHISQLAAESVISVSQLLNLTTSFLYSSKLDYRVEGQNGQDKILSICEMQNAKMYINLQNGRELYEQIKFKKKDIDLRFIHIDDLSYPQFDKKTFTPHLSIIDVLMFNGPSGTTELLTKYQLHE